jgi:hypothetical protein
MPANESTKINALLAAAIKQHRPTRTCKANTNHPSRKQRTASLCLTHQLRASERFRRRLARADRKFSRLKTQLAKQDACIYYLSKLMKKAKVRARWAKGEAEALKALIEGAKEAKEGGDEGLKIAIEKDDEVVEQAQAEQEGRAEERGSVTEAGDTSESEQESTSGEAEGSDESDEGCGGESSDSESESGSEQGE